MLRSNRHMKTSGGASITVKPDSNHNFVSFAQEYDAYVYSSRSLRELANFFNEIADEIDQPFYLLPEGTYIP